MWVWQFISKHRQKLQGMFYTDSGIPVSLKKIHLIIMYWAVECTPVPTPLKLVMLVFCHSVINIRNFNNTQQYYLLINPHCIPLSYLPYHRNIYSYFDSNAHRIHCSNIMCMKILPVVLWLSALYSVLFCFHLIWGGSVSNKYLPWIHNDRYDLQRNMVILWPIKW